MVKIDTIFKKQNMNLLSTITNAVASSEPVEVIKKGEIFHIKPERKGSISHFFYVSDGRAHRCESEYNIKSTPIPLNGLATLDEVESLICSLLELRELMKKSK